MALNYWLLYYFNHAYHKGYDIGSDDTIIEVKKKIEIIEEQRKIEEVYGRYLIKGKIGVEYLSYYFPDRKEWSSQCKVTHWKYININ